MCPRTSLATCLNAAPAKQSGPAELQATSASLRATPPSGQAELQATSASGPAVLQATSASGPAVLQATSAILPAILPETLAIGPATPARPWAALQRALATFSERDVIPVCGMTYREEEAVIARVCANFEMFQCLPDA